MEDAGLRDIRTRIDWSESPCSPYPRTLLAKVESRVLSARHATMDNLFTVDWEYVGPTTVILGVGPGHRGEWGLNFRLE